MKLSALRVLAVLVVSALLSAVLVLVPVGSVGVVVAAGGGELDPAFGAGGTVTTAIGTGVDLANSVAVQADGRIVAAGYSSNGADDDFAVVRYLANGALDTSFGTGGKVTTAIGAGSDVASSVVVQADGRIVVAGYSTIGGNVDFAVVRYLTNGALDNSFDTDGQVTTAIGTGFDAATSVVVQADGRIVVAGNSSNGTNSDVAVVRYLTNGALDTSFDTDGEVTTAIGVGAGATSVVVQADGRIVAAGNSSNGANDDFAVVRYLPNGALDTSFDTDGKVTTDIEASNGSAISVVVQADGRIVAAGYSTIGGNDEFAVVRYLANGALDTSFNTDGKVTTAIGTSSRAASVVVQADGRIVAAGYSFNGTNADFAVVRYLTNGALDTSFDTDGKVTTAIGAGVDAAASVVVQADGRIVVAGRSFIGGNVDFAVVRYISAVVANAPAAVAGVAGNAAVTVAWPGSTNDGGTAITGYVVTAAPGGASCSTAGTSCVVTGLTNGQAYTFTVRATNSVGAGAVSVASAPVTPTAPYVPLVPARLLETRTDAGLSTIDGQAQGAGLVAAGTVTELQVAGRGGIPADASAVVLNITVTGTTGAGFITAYPCGSPRPNASNLNHDIGDTVPNLVIAKIGSGGRVCLFTLAGTHLVADANGYFLA